jgi:ectoine hydroxylase-related dioxygenase (phytanoyl-CoA dioxygenase family)
LVLTVWVPLVDATADNGCMWVMPGVHKGNIARHRWQQNSWYLDIAPEDMPKAEPVCLPMRKGSILLMTNRTPHASFENTTDIVRWSMDLRYQGASLPTNAAITRLPDEILPDPSKGIPLACYPPEADFLVRSSLRPQEVITDPGVFHTIRTKHQATPVFSRW